MKQTNKFNNWCQELKEKRVGYGVSQRQLAQDCNVSREYINKIENAKVVPSQTLKETILINLEKRNPHNPLTFMFDYVRVRFPTLDVKYIAEKILNIKFDYMGYESYGFYSYEAHYYFGDIILMVSQDIEKGVLLELKGQGCRQFECFLNAQQRSWYDFFYACINEQCVFKRVDFAINDHVGILNIPLLTDKCRNEECISLFRSFKSYRSGELVRQNEKECMGNTLYIGSLKSELYFCLYEKDYEQFIKNNIPIEEATVKNRFEIRLKNERATKAMQDLLSHEDPEKTAFSIINKYLNFVDRDNSLARRSWKPNKDWLFFIGNNRERLTLTTKPEPCTILRTVKWLKRQVAPTLKLIQKIDSESNNHFMQEVMQDARLNHRHNEIVKQVTTDLSNCIVKV